MDLSNIKPAAGAVKRSKRIGRGQGSGKGGTSTKGHKGAQSRSGAKRKVGYEGGQNPIQRRLPKRGFNSPFKEEFKVINLDRLQVIAEKFKMKKVDIQSLRDSGVLRGNNAKVKILGKGEMKTKLDLEVNAISASAKTAIENAGGTVKLLDK